MLIQHAAGQEVRNDAEGLLRVRVLRAVDAAASRRSVDAKFEVSVSFVIPLTAQWRASGSAKVRGTGEGRRTGWNCIANCVTGCWRPTDTILEELHRGFAGEGVSVRAIFERAESPAIHTAMVF